MRDKFAGMSCSAYTAGTELMSVFEFTIAVEGVDPNADDFEDRFFEAGCDDALIKVAKGVVALDFSREATNLLKAIGSALEDVLRAGAVPVRIEPDPLANENDMAARAGLTRQTISNYVLGKRGAGFPLPAVRPTSAQPLWLWLDVARWLRRHSPAFDARHVVHARVIYHWNQVIAAHDNSMPTGDLAASAIQMMRPQRDSGIR